MKLFQIQFKFGKKKKNRVSFYHGGAIYFTVLIDKIHRLWFHLR